jgi:hypothetical protein
MAGEKETKMNNEIVLGRGITVADIVAAQLCRDAQLYPGVVQRSEEGDLSVVWKEKLGFTIKYGEIELVTKDIVKACRYIVDALTSNI